ncbi:MAG TPA: kynureninase [Thermoanaerobaculia bacterium]|nr:kynureninase [Thermoanaerobaculia bacterium]
MTPPDVSESLRREALERDREDPLARFRAEFVVADEGLVYLDGNSLGRLPKKTEALVAKAVREEWGGRLIRGWNEGWVDAPRRVGDKLARLLGARPGEVVVSDSTSVNLFKLAVAALKAREARSTIVTDDLNFPSDLYVLDGAARLLGGGRRVVAVPARDGTSVDPADLAAAIGPDTALVSLSHAAYRSGFLHDMRAVTEIAHRAGALVLWDVSHSAGVVPIDLEAWGVDLAVGCTYKHLNGGPGAPAFLYVRRELQTSLENPVPGWFGREAPFTFAPDFAPAAGVERFLVGTPPILSLAAAEAGVDLALEAGVPAARAKSLAMGRFLEDLWRAMLEPKGVSLRSPSEPARRGSHLSFGHPEALAIDRALIAEMNVIPDFRPPDVIRFGFAPLYTTFEELFEGVARFRGVLDEERWRRFAGEAGPVVT